MFPVPPSLLPILSNIILVKQYANIHVSFCKVLNIQFKVLVNKAELNRHKGLSERKYLYIIV